ncbi:general transcription factor II-I repeat domain-containing protein 2-like, partial [Palaemon carinicauda]|uniref:general transcription factor II-I repeat domain-containing protein 2-like n=1 Tax=Palaemon carinicauda TaxID=392227 RepID=UPI0035B5745A
MISHLQVKQFSLQLDESTLRDNEAILLAYVRFNSDEGHKEEMLFATSLVKDTKETAFFMNYVSKMEKSLKDIFEKLNYLHKKLQGKDFYLISSRSAIVAFLRKLQLYKNNFRRRAFEQFPCLASVSNDLQDDDLALYVEYMENMHKDMQNRFSDLLVMVIPTWVSIPFEVNVADIDISLQEPLIELQSDEIMRAKFNDGKYN